MPNLPASNQDMPPRIGLALSGGGARGLAHIGVLKVLEREGIPVGCLAGASMGGVIAAGYAAGMTAQDLEREARKFANPRNLLGLIDAGFPNDGLLRGRRLQRYFGDRLQGKTFAEIPRPLALLAVDLNSRREIVLREGPLDVALRATTAVPGLFSPLEIGDLRLVDGGLLNNLPVDAVRQLGADFVIAVDVEAKNRELCYDKYLGNRWLPNGLARTFATLEESVSLIIAKSAEERLRQFPPDVLLRPHIPPGVSLLSGYNRIDELISAGEDAMEDALVRMPEVSLSLSP